MKCFLKRSFFFFSFLFFGWCVISINANQLSYNTILELREKGAPVGVTFDYFPEEALNRASTKTLTPITQ
eukprot:m.103931 g.103931  ORF g.103931 m.103931 type:complete len:70 (+) comp12627_c0_seq2:67-276(+)